MFILVQFLLRLAFGLALAMAFTPSRLVTSGYYRNHSYVLLGLTLVAALVTWGRPEIGNAWFAIGATVASYVASAAWLYEKRRLGIAALLTVAAAAIGGAWSSLAQHAQSSLSGEFTASFRWLLAAIEPLASGWLLGTVIASMLLGHWYLNSPSMQIAPLRRLLVWSGGALAARVVVSGAGLGLALTTDGMLEKSYSTYTMLALRWGAGIAGTAVVLWMAWQTLKIPNTQSATGILYIGVMFTFLGELAGLLLSAAATYPL